MYENRLAMQYLEKLLAVKPDYGAALEEKGKVNATFFRRPCLQVLQIETACLLQKMGKTKESIETFEKVIKVDPLNGHYSFRMLAAVKADQGMSKK